MSISPIKKVILGMESFWGIMNPNLALTQPLCVTEKKVAAVVAAANKAFGS